MHSAGLDPFAALAALVAAAPVQVDPHRQARKGVPEVVYAPGKSPEVTLAAVWALLERTPSRRVLVSRPDGTTLDLLRGELERAGAVVEVSRSRSVALARHADAGEPPRPNGGVVGLLTAGSSDAPAADEAEWVLREMACPPVRFDDVGVAGLHRLEAPLRSLRDAGVDVVIVAAGMDGALPSVVAGLVDVPVIGLPTAVGYGLGGQGVGALLNMLQSCAPGLVVVNIENGVGAAATAALIATRAATLRSGR